MATSQNLQRISKLLSEVLAVARQYDVAVLVAAAPESQVDKQLSPPSEIIMVSHLPAHAPGRMAAARTLLTAGCTVFNEQSIIGDKLQIKVTDNVIKN